MWLSLTVQYVVLLSRVDKIVSPGNGYDTGGKKYFFLAIIVNKSAARFETTHKALERETVHGKRGEQKSFDSRLDGPMFAFPFFFVGGRRCSNTVSVPGEIFWPLPRSGGTGRRSLICTQYVLLPSKSTEDSVARSRLFFPSPLIYCRSGPPIGLLVSLPVKGCHLGGRRFVGHEERVCRGFGVLWLCQRGYCVMCQQANSEVLCQSRKEETCRTRVVAP